METQDQEESTQEKFQPYTLQAFDAGTKGQPPVPATKGLSSDFRALIPQDVLEPSDFVGHPGTTPAEDDFASIKFQRENTLLTNAESYAASVREEAELYVQQLRGEVETLNQEAELRYEEAANVKEAAEVDAQRMIEEAQAQVGTIREEARKEGYEAGLEVGQAKRYEEAGVYLERVEKVFGEISQFRKRVAYYTEKDGVRLAVMMAKKILQSELVTNKKAILKMVASTLAGMEGKGVFRVLVSESDHAFMLKARPSLERYLDEEQSLTFRAKPELAPGNVLVETDREVIDLTLDSQMFHLERRLQQTLAERETVMTRGPVETPPAAGQDQSPTDQTPPETMASAPAQAPASGPVSVSTDDGDTMVLGGQPPLPESATEMDPSTDGEG